MESKEEIELIEYTPAACKGTAEVPAKYEGKVYLRAPGFEERLGVIEQLAEVENDPDLDKPEAEMTKDEKKAKGKQNLKSLLACVKIAKPFIHRIDVKRISDGKMYSSFTQLSTNTDFDVDLPAFVGELAKTGISAEKKASS